MVRIIKKGVKHLCDPLDELSSARTKASLLLCKNVTFVMQNMEHILYSHISHLSSFHAVTAAMLVLCTRTCSVRVPGTWYSPTVVAVSALPLRSYSIHCNVNVPGIVLYIE